MGLGVSTDRPGAVIKRLLERLAEGESMIGDSSSDSEVFVLSKDFVELGVTEYPEIKRDGDRIERIGYRKVDLALDSATSSVILVEDGDRFSLTEADVEIDKALFKGRDPEIVYRMSSADSPASIRQISSKNRSITFEGKGRATDWVELEDIEISFDDFQEITGKKTTALKADMRKYLIADEIHMEYVHEYLGSMRATEKELEVAWRKFYQVLAEKTKEKPELFTREVDLGYAQAANEEDVPDPPVIGGSVEAPTKLPEQTAIVDVALPEPVVDPVGLPADEHLIDPTVQPDVDAVEPPVDEPVAEELEPDTESADTTQEPQPDPVGTVQAVENSEYVVTDPLVEQAPVPEAIVAGSYIEQVVGAPGTEAPEPAYIEPTLAGGALVASLPETGPQAVDPEQDITAARKPKHVMYFSVADFAENNDLPEDDVETMSRLGILRGKVVGDEIRVSDDNDGIVADYREGRVDMTGKIRALLVGDDWVREAELTEISEIRTLYSMDHRQTVIALSKAGAEKAVSNRHVYRRKDVVDKLARIGILPYYQVGTDEPATTHSKPPVPPEPYKPRSPPAGNITESKPREPVLLEASVADKPTASEPPRLYGIDQIAEIYRRPAGELTSFLGISGVKPIILPGGEKVYIEHEVDECLSGQGMSPVPLDRRPPPKRIDLAAKPPADLPEKPVDFKPEPASVGMDLPRDPQLGSKFFEPASVPAHSSRDPEPAQAPVQDAPAQPRVSSSKIRDLFSGIAEFYGGIGDQQGSRSYAKFADKLPDGELSLQEVVSALPPFSPKKHRLVERLFLGDSVEDVINGVKQRTPVKVEKGELPDTKKPRVPYITFDNAGVQLSGITGRGVSREEVSRFLEKSGAKNLGGNRYDLAAVSDCLEFVRMDPSILGDEGSENIEPEPAGQEKRRGYTNKEAGHILGVDPKLVPTITSMNYIQPTDGLYDPDEINRLAKELSDQRGASPVANPHKAYLTANEFSESSSIPIDDVETMFRFGLLDGKVNNRKIMILDHNDEAIERYRGGEFDFGKMVAAMNKTSEWMSGSNLCDEDDIKQFYGLGDDGFTDAINRSGVGISDADVYTRKEIVDGFSRIGLLPADQRPEVDSTQDQVDQYESADPRFSTELIEWVNQGESSARYGIRMFYGLTEKELDSAIERGGLDKHRQSYSRAEIAARFLQIGLSPKPRDATTPRPKPTTRDEIPNAAAPRPLPKLLPKPKAEAPEPIKPKKKDGVCIERSAVDSGRVGDKYILDLEAMHDAIRREGVRFTPSEGDGDDYIGPEHVSRGFGYRYDKVQPVLSSLGVEATGKGVRKAHITGFIQEVVRKLNPEIADRLLVSFGFEDGRLTGLVGAADRSFTKPEERLMQETQTGDDGDYDHSGSLRGSLKVMSLGKVIGDRDLAKRIGSRYGNDGRVDRAKLAELAVDPNSGLPEGVRTNILMEMSLPVDRNKSRGIVEDYLRSHGGLEQKRPEAERFDPTRNYTIGELAKLGMARDDLDLLKQETDGSAPGWRYAEILAKNWRTGSLGTMGYTGGSDDIHNSILHDKRRSGRR